jgi:hypothetical protein
MWLSSPVYLAVVTILTAVLSLNMYAAALT